MKKLTFSILEVSEIIGLDKTVLEMWIANEWVSPPSPGILDQEDVARLRFIHELQADFGANEEAIPLILHLVDQLYNLREQLRSLPKEASK